MRFGSSIVVLSILVMVMGWLLVTTGSVDVDWNNIQHQELMTNYRLPKAIAAFLIGGMVATAGLLLQNVFQNVLAGPSVLGVSSGASLGAGLFYLASGVAVIGQLAGVTALSSGGLVLGSIIGACLVLLLMLLISQRLSSSSALLVAGLMVGAMVSAVVSVLQFFSEPEQLQAFLLWSFGSLSRIGWVQLYWLIGIFALVTAIILFMSRSLNVAMLGREGAANLGVNYKTVRTLMILLAGILSGAATAFCGPIGFVGIIVPHIARFLAGSTAHQKVLPMTLLTGGVVLMLCEWIAQLPGSNLVLPLNAITAAIGGPVILWMLLERRLAKTIS